MFNDLTLVTCNYNTPIITLTMLKSWKKVNANITNKLILIDNSVNEDTAIRLHENNTPFYRNPDGRHYEGVQIALDKCKTRYMLLVDTDVIFKENLFPIVEKFINSGCALMGEECGNRGGYNLFTRIHPWFCFIDVSKINKLGIKFINVDKIKATLSGEFYSNIPIARLSNNKKYDVGATFYEDIIEKGLTVNNIKLDPRYYYHYEGLSWRGVSGNPNLMNANRFNLIRYANEEAGLKNEPLINWYVV